MIDILYSLKNILKPSPHGVYAEHERVHHWDTPAPASVYALMCVWHWEILTVFLLCNLSAFLTHITEIKGVVLKDFGTERELIGLQGQRPEMKRQEDEVQPGWSSQATWQNSWDGPEGLETRRTPSVWGNRPVSRHYYTPIRTAENALLNSGERECACVCVSLSSVNESMKNEKRRRREACDRNSAFV